MQNMKKKIKRKSYRGKENMIKTKKKYRLDNVGKWLTEEKRY